MLSFSNSSKISWWHLKQLTTTHTRKQTLLKTVSPSLHCCCAVINTSTSWSEINQHVQVHHTVSLLINTSISRSEQMTAECWRWRPRWNRLASSASCFGSSACLQSSSSILMRDSNTATDPNFRKSLSKCRILSPKNSYLSISDVNGTPPTLPLASIDQLTSAPTNDGSFYI